MKSILAASAALFALSGVASAMALNVVSYSYLSPGPTTGGYADSGGELTDGVAATIAWKTGATITLADVVPLTGWDQFRSPTIRFQFAEPVTVQAVTTWFADSNNSAGVGMPGLIQLRTDDASFSQDFTIIDPPGAGSTVASVLGGFSVTTDHLIVQAQAVYYWTMLSEVTFSSVPEPSHLALWFGLVCLLGVFTVRRR